MIGDANRPFRRLGHGENSFIAPFFGDPKFERQRNDVMITTSLYEKPAGLPYTRATKTGNAVTEPTQQTPPMTQWLVAVRDQRDRAAFGLLFDYFAPRLKGFIMRNGTGAAQAEEIVQDVMLTVWLKASLFDPHRAQASAWIYQIARNRQIDIIRKENRPIPDELTQDPGSEPDASQILALGQETEQLKTAIEQLQPEQKAMIEQAYLGDLTHQEISTKTGLPLGTVKSRIRLGLRRLRKELEGLR